MASHVVCLFFACYMFFSLVLCCYCWRIFKNFIVKEFTLEVRGRLKKGGDICIVPVADSC